MDWVHHNAKSRGPEWKKQGWMSGLAVMSSASAPPLPLLAIFSIVIFLLSLSHYSAYKDRVEHTMIGFRVFAYLVPLALVFLVSSSFRLSRFNLWNQKPRKQPSAQQMMMMGRGGEFPWGVAILVLLLILLMSCHSILWG